MYKLLVRKKNKHTPTRITDYDKSYNFCIEREKFFRESYSRILSGGLSAKCAILCYDFTSKFYLMPREGSVPTEFFVSAREIDNRIFFFGKLVKLWCVNWFLNS